MLKQKKAKKSTHGPSTIDGGVEVVVNELNDKNPITSEFSLLVDQTRRTPFSKETEYIQIPLIFLMIFTQKKLCDVLLPNWYTIYSESVYLWSLKDRLCLSDVPQYSNYVEV